MSRHPYAVMERVRLSRAFTCFQLSELIENAPASPEPLFVLDLLTTFYDESVPLRDTERLLGSTITHLKRLAACGPVIVGVYVTYHSSGLRGVPQLRVAATLAVLVGRQLARSGLGGTAAGFGSG